MSIIPRRSFLKGILASPLASLASLGLGRARAAGPAVEALAAPLKPAACEYQLMGVLADGQRYHASWPMLDLAEITKVRESLLRAGRQNPVWPLVDVEIVRRPVGETMQLPDEPCPEPSN